MEWGDLEIHGQTLSPLTPSLRGGLTAIAVLASVSFAASTTLFLYLTYRLIVGRLAAQPEQPRPIESPPRSSHDTTDFTLGIEGIFTQEDTEAAFARNKRRQALSRLFNGSPPNQFLILIYNLLLADIHQSLAFLLNAAWLNQDAITVSTPTCFAQGLLLSTGDLSSSIFITTIAVHTYLSVVRKRQPPQHLLYAVILCNWIFVYVISLMPIAATRNGADRGGFFVRAGAWCWMNKEYELLRLVTHYLFIFIALLITSALYISVFVSLRRQRISAKSNSLVSLRHEPAFLIYPLIYVACTLPLALGRVATMAGKEVPMGYFCFAGALIACNGFLDCLLFGTTRKAIIFGTAPHLAHADTGLKTFAFLKTPSTRRYGNMIWIQGGCAEGTRRGRLAAVGAWCFGKWPGASDRRSDREWPRGHRPRNSSQQSLRGSAIHLDTVTSVEVEVGGEKVPCREMKRLQHSCTIDSISASMTSAGGDSCKL